MDKRGRSYGGTGLNGAIEFAQGMKKPDFETVSRGFRGTKHWSQAIVWTFQPSIEESSSMHCVESIKLRDLDEIAGDLEEKVQDVTENDIMCLEVGHPLNIECIKDLILSFLDVPMMVKKLNLDRKRNRYIELYKKHGVPKFGKRRCPYCAEMLSNTGAPCQCLAACWEIEAGATFTIPIGNSEYESTRPRYHLKLADCGTNRDLTHAPLKQKQNVRWAETLQNCWRAAMGVNLTNYYSRPNKKDENTFKCRFTNALSKAYKEVSSTVRSRASDMPFECEDRCRPFLDEHVTQLSLDANSTWGNEMNELIVVGDNGENPTFRFRTTGNRRRSGKMDVIISKIDRHQKRPYRD